jgi:holo-[acyl-carrier protein] synthase
MPVIGVGLDLLDISRMEDKIENAAFLDKVFTEAEQAYISGRGKFSAASAAGIFCAKEAFVKAVGEGLSIPLREIEVCHDARGKPFLKLTGNTCDRFSGVEMSLSITHTDTVAAAVVVISEEK